MEDDIVKIEKRIDDYITKTDLLIKDMDRRIIRMEFEYERIVKTLSSISGSMEKIRDSILGIAGEEGKIGLSGELRTLSTKLENIDRSIIELKSSQKQQDQFNLQTVAKTSVIPIILIILIEVGKHFIGSK